MIFTAHRAHLHLHLRHFRPAILFRSRTGNEAALLLMKTMAMIRLCMTILYWTAIFRLVQPSRDDACWDCIDHSGEIVGKSCTIRSSCFLAIIHSSWQTITFARIESSHALNVNMIASTVYWLASLADQADLDDWSFLYRVDLQGWPDELPLIINGTLDTGNNGAKEYGWQLDIPVVLFGFCFCITVLLILVQVSQIHQLYML
jgi:hypothetical protein